MKFTELKRGDRFHPPDFPDCYIPSVFDRHVMEGGLWPQTEATKDPAYKVFNFVLAKWKHIEEKWVSTVVKEDGTLLDKVWRDGVVIWEGLTWPEAHTL